ncbi:MAG: transporter substrate-binding domain-containing protein [Alphaproteobacteria bacterium]|nr:transporter substrate-binding domain-containing protein [Alphaproteobacteria bacterium]
MKRFLYFIGVVYLLSIGGFVGPVNAQVGDTQPVRKYVEQEVQKETGKRQKIPFECGYTKPMKVAGFVTNPPFGWVDVIPGDSTRPDMYFNDGFAYQLFYNIASQLGIKVENKGFTSYHAALTALKKGELDVLVGSYYDKRTLGVGTSILFPSYIKNPIVVAFKMGKEKEVKSLEDLMGLKGGIRQEEMIYSLLYDSIPEGVQMEQIAGSREAYSRLMLGQIDYLITSLYAAEAEIRRFKITDKIILTRVPLMEPELFFVFSANTGCRLLKPQFEEQLRKEKDNSANISGLLFEQVDKWADRFRYEEPLIDVLSKTIAPKMPEKASDIKQPPNQMK